MACPKAIPGSGAWQSHAGAQPTPYFVVFDTEDGHGRPARTSKDFTTPRVAAAFHVTRPGPSVLCKRINLSAERVFGTTCWTYQVVVIDKSEGGPADGCA